MFWNLRATGSPDCPATLLAPATRAGFPFLSGAAGSGTSFFYDYNGVSPTMGTVGIAYMTNPTGLAFVENGSSQTAPLPLTASLAAIDTFRTIGLTGLHYQGVGAPDSGVVYYNNGTGASFSWRYPQNGFLGSGVGLVIVGSNPIGNNTVIALFNDETSSTLATIQNATLAVPGPSSAVTLAPSFRAAPLLGKGGLLYLPGGSGVMVRPIDGGQPWMIDVPGSSDGGFITSPNIDCTRSAAGSAIAGRPGVLYVIRSSRNLGAFREGELFAIIVDSPGIETASLWPKAFHDPRNTNNSSTSLAEFACP